MNAKNLGNSEIFCHVTCCDTVSVADDENDETVLANYAVTFLCKCILRELLFISTGKPG